MLSKCRYRKFSTATIVSAVVSFTCDWKLDAFISLL